MCAKVGSQSNTTAEEEDGVEDVEDDHNQRVDGNGFDKGCGNEIEQGQHAEDGNEHLIVNHGRVAVGSLRNNVADECHDEESPEELRGGEQCVRGPLDHEKCT